MKLKKMKKNTKIFTLGLTKTFILSAVLLVFCNNAKAQTFELPKYEIKTAKDCEALEPKVLEAIDYLMNTPPIKKPLTLEEINQERNRLNTLLFIMSFAESTDKCMIDLNYKVATFLKSKNYNILVIFASGWIKNALTTNTDNKLVGNMAGIEMVIDYYGKYKDILGKNKEIEKYIKLQNEGKLEEFIKSKI